MPTEKLQVVLELGLPNIGLAVEWHLDDDRARRIGGKNSDAVGWVASDQRIDKGGKMESIHLSGRGRTVALLVCLSLMLTVFGGVGIAGADSVYHTERLELTPVGGSGETGSGMVVNIHPNGPVVGAQERYQIKNAQPNTEYVVWLVVGGADFMPTATIETDGQGNGHAKARFSAADLAPFSGAVLPVKWVLRIGAEDAYETDTTIVTLD